MKIALVQMNVISGNPEINVENMLSKITEAKNNKADIVVFPELCVSGYLVSDKFTEDSYCEWLISFNETLKDASKDIVLIYGNIYINKNKKNQDGRIRKYNGACIFQNGNLLEKTKKGKMYFSFQPKTLLPNYRFFDDERYFSSNLDRLGDNECKNIEDLFNPFVVNIKCNEYKIAIQTCEDIWSDDYNVNPTKLLTKNGSDFIINISASPWTYGKNKARDNTVEKTFKDIIDNNLKPVPLYYVNNVGVQNNGKNIITFDGGTTVYGSDGKPRIISENMFTEEIIYVDHEEVDNKPIIERKVGNKIEEKYLAIKQGLRFFPENQKWVIGISGGLDSALSACLLVDTFGNKNITGVNMPTKYNSKKTKTVAKTVCKNLRIPYKIVPIEKLVKNNKDILKSIGGTVSELTTENIQARIRSSNVLSTISSHIGALYPCNGNKLEIALGYATLYGDVNGAICPIGDLTKTEIVQMCKWINESRNIFPKELLPNDMFQFENWQIQPSAELKENQIDPMKFGYHCGLLEKIMDYKKAGITDVMEWYLDGTLAKNLNISVDLIKRWNIDISIVFLKDLVWFFQQINNNVFKRIQSPPIISLSKSSFGFDYRESQLPFHLNKKYYELEEKIKCMKKYEERI